MLRFIPSTLPLHLQAPELTILALRQPYIYAVFVIQKI